MDILIKIFGKTCCRSMRLLGRSQCLVVLFSVFSACVYGLKVDISRLRQLRRPYILDKRTDLSCTGNPCPPWQPFLCKSSSVCIALAAVCDDHPDCPDHFDEDKELCNARKRPSIDNIYNYLERNRKWIVQKLFSGGDIELIAHSLAVGTSIDDISMIVGLTPDAEQNLEDAFYAVLNNDMRPLLKMGMPKGEWFDTSAMFNQIVDGGFLV